ncbi:MAG: HAD-IIA family hydrolase [Oscillospiraceae bacterium]|nr:HAD-IIA family hydrolase [Oscillospiraceae bacterium]
METYNDIKCFIVDMDGTFYLGDELLPGALDFSEAIKKTGRRFFFFTNNSSHSEEECLERLRRIGYNEPDMSVIISSHVAIDYIKRNRPGKSVYLLGNENLTKDFIKAGIELSDSDPDIVVLGFDTTLTYEKINTAARFLSEGKEYFATHPDDNCPLKNGFMVDTGSMIAMFHRSTGRCPDIVFGKPYAYTVDFVTHKIGCKREEIAFVGDRLATDIAIGAKNGLKTALVYTGVTSPELYVKSDIKASAAFNNIGELGKLLTENYSEG